MGFVEFLARFILGGPGKKKQQNFWVGPTRANPAYMSYVASDFRMWNKASGLWL